jgi:sterol desaturase/sphingolipid hydroxylase (fatty acid hydroxylase superfamily)
MSAPVALNEALLLRTAFQWGGLLFLLAWEAAAPYRPSTVSKLRRWFINLPLSLGNGIVLALIFAPLTLAAVVHVREHRAGVLELLGAGPWLRGIVAVGFLDLILYVWHLLNHEMPTLWRFHRVHHSDLNMDVSTAGRFHLGELAISSVIKIGLVFFLGITLWELLAFESLLVLAAQFQHSSVRVSPSFEQVFWVLFVPPSMHRIHHSVVIRERNTNYGTILSVWDRIFGTLRTDVDQSGIRIGVGAYSRPEKLGIVALLGMPFTPPVP